MSDKQWEFQDAVMTCGWQREYGLYWTATMVRQDLWADKQSDLLPWLQGWIDAGWEPISEIGPSAFKITQGKTKWWMLSPVAFKWNILEFRVTMRRLKT